MTDQLDFIDRACVRSAMEDGRGFWRACVGCHESHEGVPNGPFSEARKCHVGFGCHECGGIGTTWDTTDYAAMGAAIAAEPTDTTFDLIQHLHRQRAFSEQTYGPPPRTQMVIDHARKELVEVEANPTALMEWVDVILLALDGAWRAGHEPAAIAAGIMAKQTINEGRKWPDWRTADPTKAIEHVRVQIEPDDTEACIACAIPFNDGDPDRRRDLVRAAALIIAEIERLDRLASLNAGGR